ncbi:hypothetical protein BC629DRAFT_1593871 [Irpex lacteus]|nr:hypothetical protein BC629DRAFT_1593871 [Irpex lacteus]
MAEPNPYLLTDVSNGELDFEPTPSHKPPFPINSLPPELLAQILILWSHTDPDAPWLAVLVCHHWRTTALATNTVWSQITLHLVPSPSDDIDWLDEEELALLNSPRGKRRPHALWIERAHDADVSLHITALASYPHMQQQLYQTLSLLAEHVERVKRVVLCVQYNYLADVALGILFQRAPGGYVLPHLEVQLEEKIPKELRRISHMAQVNLDPSTFQVLDEFWTYCPPVKSLNFRGCYAPRNPHPQTFVHTQTLTLSHASLPPSHFLKDAHHFTSLRTLTLDSSSSGQGYILSEELTLPHLTTLRLLNLHTSSCTHYFGLLSTPSLTSLSIRNEGLKELRELWTPQEGNSWYDCLQPFGDAFEEFVQRAPELRTLHLDRCPIDDRHLLRVLQAARGLEELGMDYLLVGTPAIRGLTPSLSPPPSVSGSRGQEEGEEEVICPRLRRLIIENCASIKKRDLLGFLEARATRPRCAREQLVGLAGDVERFSGATRVVVKDIE